MAINLRKVTEAFIADGSITNAKLANNAVDASKIADGSIDLTSGKVIGLLPNGKLDIITDVAKIQDDLLTLAKMKDDVKVNPFIGGENEQSVEGTTETDLVFTGFPKVPNRFAPKKLRVIASLKVEGSGNTAFLKVYIDDEVSERLILNSTQTEYELVDGEIDISDLANGRHKITVKGYTDNASAKCWNDYLDILFVK